MKKLTEYIIKDLRLMFIVSSIIMLFMIQSAFAYDTNETISIGTNSLPVSGNSTFSFKLLANETLYFDLVNKSSEIDLVFPASYTFNGNETYNFTMNWDVSESIFPNDITLDAEVLVTNSLNLNNYSLGLVLDIVKEGNRIFDINGSESLVLRDGMYIKDVTWDLLPDNGTLNFFIQGNPSEQFTITGCGKFFECSNQSFILDSNGVFELLLGYKIPIDTALGTYNETFNVSSAIRNSSITVQFNINNPSLFMIPPELSEICNKANPTITEQIQCEEELTAYQLEKIRAIQEYWSKVNTEKICAQLVKTEYVVGDTISAIVTENYLEAQNDNKNLREDNNYLQSELTICKEEKGFLQLEINETILTKNEEILEVKDTESSKRVALFKASEQDKDQSRSDTILWMKVFTFLGFLVCLILALGKFVYENIFLKEIMINYYITAVIGALFLFSWFGLWVWG